MKILIIQRKNSTESLANRTKEAENRVSGTEDKAEELDQTKAKKKILRKYKWSVQFLLETIKRPNL
jgi:hypothetical protein